MTTPESRYFLLEIGCEELPDRMIVPALEHLGREFALLAERERLGVVVREPELAGTPRRLALRARGLETRQEDREVQVLGPRAAAAFDAGGRPTPAVLGFARSQGVAVEDLVRVESPRGECLAVRRREPGKSAAEVLSAGLPSLIAGIPFAKAMRWGDGDFRFGRPIHWIVCLMGMEIVHLTVAGIVSGRTTRGARFRGSRRIEIPDARDYVGLLEREGVVVDVAERRRRVRSELEEECRRIGPRLKREENPELEETLAQLVEHPVACRGDFDPSFLRLPAAVLSTAMIHHQRFVPVRSADGSVAPHYVAILNCEADPATRDRIRRGNEWVLRARLRDADFFWKEDGKRTLEERIPDLDRVLFEARLGSFRRKAERVARLVEDLGAEIRTRGGDLDLPAAVQAARLSRSDLTTLMVKEFPELQGVMGGLYGRRESLPEPVCRALEQLYRGAGEGTAREEITTPEAAVLVVADRLDTLAGFFRVGKAPTGSRDPFGLRRAAIALVQATLDQRLRFDLDRMVERSRELYASQGIPAVKGEDEKLKPFLEERLRRLGQERHRFRYDAVNAALAIGYSDLVDAFRRIEALHGIRGHSDFEALSLSFRRIRNILAGQDILPFTGASLPEAEEQALLRAILRVEETAGPHLAAGEYSRALPVLASLRSPLDRFFEKVLVMDPDPGKRARRLSLLKRVAELLLRVGDFAEMVMEGETVVETAKEAKRG